MLITYDIWWVFIIPPNIIPWAQIYRAYYPVYESVYLLRLYWVCMLNLYPDTIRIMRVSYLRLDEISTGELCNMISGNNKIIQNFVKEITLRTYSNFNWVVEGYRQYYFGQVWNVSVGFCACDVQVLLTDLVKVVKRCIHLQTSTLTNFKRWAFITAL